MGSLLKKNKYRRDEENVLSILNPKLEEAEITPDSLERKKNAGMYHLIWVIYNYID